MTRRREDERASIQHMRQCARIARRVGGDFGEGLVASGADELLELPVCYRRAIDPEPVTGTRWTGVSSG